MTQHMGWPWPVRGRYDRAPVQPVPPLWPAGPTRPLSDAQQAVAPLDAALDHLFAAHDALASEPGEVAAELERAMAALLLRRHMLARRWA